MTADFALPVHKSPRAYDCSADYETTRFRAVAAHASASLYNHTAVASGRPAGCAVPALHAPSLGQSMAAPFTVVRSSDAALIDATTTAAITQLIASMTLCVAHRRCDDVS